MKTFFYLLLSILLIAIAGGTWFIYDNTDGCSTEFKTFYVEYAEHHLPEESSEIYFQGVDYRFNVVYPLSFVDKDQKGYTVKIFPNSDAEDVVYNIDDRYYSFNKLNEITSAFDIKLEDSYFTLSIPQGFNIGTVLSRLYPDKTVELDEEEYLESDEPFYTMIISSYDGENQCTVHFGIIDGLVKGVSLNTKRVEF